MLLLVARAPSLQQHANIAQLLGHLLVDVEALWSLDLVRLHADVGPLLLRGLVLHAQDDSHGFK